MRIALGIFVLFFTFSHSSYTQESAHKIGGLNRYHTESQYIVENATLRILYKTKYFIIKKNKTITQIDTMALVAGNNYSVYYDINRETKYSNMIGQLDGAKKVVNSIHYDPFIAFSEYAIHEDKSFEFRYNRENSEILKDRTNNIITTTDINDSDIMKIEFYLLEEKIMPQNWSLHHDMCEIMGYLCQKATCEFRGRFYTAWFSMDIPVNDGPYKFYGLPGMILKLEDSEKQFLFEVIGIEKLENTQIVGDDKKEYIVCTPKQYNDIKKRMQETSFFYYLEGKTLYATKKRIPIEYIPIELIF